MANQNKQLNVSDVDFDNIKSNLKEFLRSQTTFQDYNFEGSALSTLLDVMAYVTHYNAINANLGINETFLETAQTRGSVVGHARQLGYTPRSQTGATALINVSVTNPSSQNLTIQKNHRFKTTYDGVTYNFVTTQAYETTDAVFNNVEIKQGIVKRIDYIYDVASSEKFTIPDANVDTSTLVVNVRNSLGSSTVTTYSKMKDIVTVTGDSRVYLLNETYDGKFEITFGDGVIGSQLTNGNIIEIDYLITEGEEANGASAFSMIDAIQGNSVVNITIVEAAAGGRVRDTVQQIKYQAPLTFTSQNRAVTPDDYKSIILENYNNAESISVWGGEDNDPPDYGKAFISIKPIVGEIVSNTDKEYIVNTILRPKSMVSITPIFVDPLYTYVSLEVFFKYNAAETSLTASQLNDKVRTAISNYNNVYLEKFDGVLRYSTLLRSVDTADKSISNSSVRVYMKKRFVPILNQNVRYEIQFSSPIYITDSSEPLIYKSSTFTYNEEQCTLQDYVDTNGDRKIRIIRGSGINQITLANDVGYIDAAAGKLILTAFNPSSYIGPYIELTVLGNSNDVAPKRNNIVSIDMSDVVISGSNDPVLTGSSAGGTNYNLTPRHA